MDEILHTKLGLGLDFDPLEEKQEVSAVASNDGLNTLPTIEEIRKLACHNPILNTAMHTARVNGLVWEKALMFSVKCLVKANDEAQEKIIKYAQKYGTL